MSRFRGTLAILAFAFLLSVIAGGYAVAADAKAQTFGSIDIEKAFNDYNKKKSLDQELGAFAEGLREKLQLRKDNALLKADEFKQLADLKAKPKPTADEQKKIDELLNLSKQRSQDYAALQQKPSPTDEDKAKLQAFQGDINAANAAMEKDGQDYEGQFMQKKVELSQQVMKSVETEVAAIAKEKGLTMVFNKSLGEIQFIVFSTMDITDEVLKRLNK